MIKIVLIGYMGSGKSSVGRLLSKMSDIKYYDLDQFIEESQHKSIAEIFKSHGEVYFRKVESILFREILQKKESYILALGGGTPCYANNHQLLDNPDVISVYLKTSVDTLVKRLQKEQHIRPLIAHLSQSELQDYIRKHLFDRGYYYHQARYAISTDNKTPQEIAQELLSIIENQA